MNPNVDIKICRTCGIENTLDKFYKAKRNSDGYESTCKICTKERVNKYRVANSEKIKVLKSRYQQSNFDKIKSYQTEYRAANSEKVRLYHAKYRQDNIEQCKERECKYYQNNSEKRKGYQVGYRSANSEKIKEYKVKYRLNNTEKTRESIAKWRIANPEKINAISSKRRAAKLQSIPSWLNNEDQQAMEDMYKEAARLTQLTGIKHHVDHIHPIQGELICGLHCPTNLQILTESENLKKRNKFTSYVENTP